MTITELFAAKIAILQARIDREAKLLDHGAGTITAVEDAKLALLDVQIEWMKFGEGK